MSAGETSLGRCRVPQPPRPFRRPRLLASRSRFGVWAAAASLALSVPGGLKLPEVDPRTLFCASFLSRSASYELLLSIDALAGGADVLVAVLVLYARRGQSA